MMSIPQPLRLTLSSLSILLVIILALLLPSLAFAQSGTVQVVLYYSTYCGHCARMITEDLPPILQTYNTSYRWSYYGTPPNEETGQMPEVVAFEGDVLQMIYIDASTQIGNDLYLKMVEHFQLPPERQVVPIMVVGEQLLIGGYDIPNELPGLVDNGLSQGGLSWPEISGLDVVVSSLVPFDDQAQPTPTPQAEATPEQPAGNPQPPAGDPPVQDPSFDFDASKLSVLERIRVDPLGNSLSIVVLIGMLISLVGAGLRWRLAEAQNPGKPLSLLIPILILIGTVVASYLSFVETTGTEAVCGPVGDCNTVQSSSYALLFGILPVGVLGLLGNLAMLAAWLVARRTAPPLTDYAALALFGMALFGTAFSIYLTFLEPFVIGATCMWCLTSAVLMTLIMLLSVDRGRLAYRRWRAAAS